MAEVNALKNEIDRICKQLAEKGEESVFVTVNLEQTTCFVIGSDVGLKWLDMQSALIHRFFHFCSDHYKTLEKAKETFQTEEKSNICSLENGNVQSPEKSFISSPGKFNVNLAGVQSCGEVNDLIQCSPEKATKNLEKPLISPKKNIAEATVTTPKTNITETPWTPPKKNIRETLATPPKKNITETLATPPKKNITETLATPLNKNITETLATPPNKNITETLATPPKKNITETLATPPNKNITETLATPPNKNITETLSTLPKTNIKETLATPPKMNISVMRSQTLPPQQVMTPVITGELTLPASPQKVVTSDMPPTINRTVLRSKRPMVNNDSLSMKRKRPEKLEESQSMSDVESPKVTSINSTPFVLNTGVSSSPDSRPKRTPKPKKLHQMECYVKLRNIDLVQYNKHLQSTIKDDPSLNRSEISGSRAEVKVNSLNVEHDRTYGCYDFNEKVTGSNCFDKNLNVDNTRNKSDDEDFLPFEVGGDDDDDDNDDDVELSDDDLDDVDNTTNNRPKKKKKIQTFINTCMDSEDLFENYFNRVKRRILRNTRDRFGCLRCSTCNLTFNSVKGFKQHQLMCNFKCPACDAACQSLQAMEVHVEIHKNMARLKCRFCDEKFILIGSLQRHTSEMHTERDKHFCPFCSKKFIYPYTLRQHIRTIHEKPFYCGECKSLFETEFAYNDHMVKNHSTKMKINAFTCKKCGKAFELLHLLKRHNRYFHKAKGERICKLCLEYFPDGEKYREHLQAHEWDRPNTCQFCRNSFDTKASLDDHIRAVHNHGISYICEVCGFEANNSRDLKYHRMEHEENMPYTCHICKKGFPLKLKYRSHMLNHSDELPFVCEICGKRFKRHTTLRSHRIVHSEGLTCKFCDRNFRSVGGLDYHIVRMHADKVNTENYRKTLHKCEECNIFFPSKNLYETHMVRHDKTRTYKCSRCQKTFKTEQHKLKHEANHEETKPFYCVPCEKGFATKARWQAHQQTNKHNVNQMQHETRHQQRCKVEPGTNQSSLGQVIGANESILIQEVGRGDMSGQITSATMIDLPETTILVIGDYGNIVARDNGSISNAIHIPLEIAQTE